MRPVRFVAISEDGRALVLADEVGRLLALPIDDRLSATVRHEPESGGGRPLPSEAHVALSPRDIQARIRSGESAEDVARIANVPVDRVLRYAGPVLQERAMLAQHARRTRLRSSERGASLAEVVDARLAKHGVDAEKVSWDAYRKEDGTWRVLATWPSGKATAQAVWDLDRPRQVVTPADDMAHYLCTERPAPLLGQEPPSEPTHRGHEAGTRSLGGVTPRGPDPIRGGRDALLATLDRPLGAPGSGGVPGSGGGTGIAAGPGSAGVGSGGRGLTPGRIPGGIEPAATRFGAPAARPTGVPGTDPNRLSVSAFAEDDMEAPKEVPDVPSLAVLRPRRGGGPSTSGPSTSGPGSSPAGRGPGSGGTGGSGATAGEQVPGSRVPTGAALGLDSFSLGGPGSSGGVGNVAGQGSHGSPGSDGEDRAKPRKRLPAWDDVLFGTGPSGS